MKHDYKVYKINHHDIPPDVESMFDLELSGVEKGYPTEQKSSFPFKKEKYCELTVQQKSTTEIIPREE